MEPVLAEAVRKQLPQIKALEQYGPIQSIKFEGVGDAGWDVYGVQRANGRIHFRIIMGNDGKIAGLLSSLQP